MVFYRLGDTKDQGSGIFTRKAASSASYGKVCLKRYALQTNIAPSPQQKRGYALASGADICFLQPPESNRAEP